MTNTDFVILGFLHHGDFSGYDIKKLIDDSIPHFWEESYTKIYQSLKKLEESEHLYSMSVDQVGKPDKKVYGITDKGKESFVGWIKQENKRKKDINALLLKLFFAEPKTSENIKVHFESYLKEIEETLIIYKDYLEFIKQQKESNKKTYWLLTVEYAILQNETQIDWIKKVLSKI